MCLNNDFNSHLYNCPLVLPDTTKIEKSTEAPEEGGSRVQVPTLMQPGSSGTQRGILIDDEDVIARVRSERWQLSKTRQEALEEIDKDVTKCEEARDRVLEWCVHHNPRSNMEAWRAATARV
jgi:hypothetical protein